MKTKHLKAVSAVCLSALTFFGNTSKAVAQSQPGDYIIDSMQRKPLSGDLLIGGNASHFNEYMRTWSDTSMNMIKNIGVTSLRTHDIKCLDWDIIFPNFEADVNNPANYVFAPGDAILGKLTDMNYEIFLRLGVSVEAQSKKRYPGIKPPDNNKWTQIVSHILDHYVNGWANTRSFNIKSVEVWNEPDLGFWGGTQADFIALAKASLPVLESKFPSLKFGGFAFANIRTNQAFVENLLTALSDPNGDGNQSDRIRLDFFSWHVYELKQSSPMFQLHASTSKDLLKKYGYTQTKSFCTEWNADLPSTYLNSQSAESDICSTLIYAANGNVNGMYFYPLVDSWGLINTQLPSMDYRKWSKTRLYNAFSMFTRAYSNSTGCITVPGEHSDNDILVTLSADGKKMSILVSRKSLSETGTRLYFRNFSINGSSTYIETVTSGLNQQKPVENFHLIQDNVLVLYPSELQNSDVALITIVKP